MTSEWRDRAECAYADPTLFDRPNGKGFRIPRSAQIAASYCAECPVKAECREDADDAEDEGVRGGEMGYRTSSGKYHRLPIVPLPSTPIPVTLHPSARAFPNDPERAAS